MQSTDKLAELIRQKHQVLAQLRDLGHRQLETVAHGDTAALLQLLAVKQQLISGLQELERNLAPYQADNPEQRSWRSAEDRLRCAQQAAQCNELLSEVVELEKISMDKMAIRRNEAAEQLRQVHSAAEARNAYEAHRLNGPHSRVENPRHEVAG